MNFVKIGDESIPKEDRQTLREFNFKLNKGPYAGFNLIFGNVYNKNGMSSDPEKLYYCQNQNHDNLNKTEPAVLIDSGHVHGCSNGNFNKWEKVKVGK